MPLWPPGQQSQGLCPGCSLSVVAAGRKAEVWVCPSLSLLRGHLQEGQSVPCLGVMAIEIFFNPQMCLKEELAMKAFSKCSKACSWRGKTLLFWLCFHFIAQLLNFVVVKYISIWKQTSTFITFTCFLFGNKRITSPNSHLHCEFDLEYVILHAAIMQFGGHERMPRSPLEQLWGITEPAPPIDTTAHHRACLWPTQPRTA